MTSIVIADITQVSMEMYNEMYSLADCERRKKTDSYIYERDRILSVVSEMCLYYLLATGFGIESSLISKGYKGNGKPYLKNLSNLYYSISHSCNKCIIGVSDQSEIGLDIESISEFEKARYRDTIVKLFSCEEIAKVRYGKNDLVRALILWTKKEALFKSLGKGSLKCVLYRNLTEVEMNNIISVLYNDYIISIANSCEKIERFEAENIGVQNMIKCVRSWKNRKG